MNAIPVSLLAIAVPSLLLFAIGEEGVLATARSYHEVFGNGDYYLDLYYGANPNGWFSPADRKRFHGRWSTDLGEWEITGWREGHAETLRYVFELPNGKFTGHLRQDGGGCEPSLQFLWQGPQARSRYGELRAGFCF